MLNKRTQILFDQDLWNTLNDLAKRKNTSVGKLVRTAVKEKYEEEKILNERKKAVEAIHKFREKYGSKLAKGEDSAIIIRKLRDKRYGHKK